MTLALHYYPLHAANHYRFYGRGADLTAAGFEVLLAASDMDVSDHYDTAAAFGEVVVDLAAENGQTWAVTVDHLPDGGRLDSMFFVRDESTRGGVSYLEGSLGVAKAIETCWDLHAAEEWMFVRAAAPTQLLEWRKQARARQLDARALFGHLAQVHVCFEFCAEWGDTLLFARPTPQWNICVERVLQRFSRHVVRH